jgi:hypothetical protein
VEPSRTLILPGSRNLCSGSRESVITAGIRRSPVVVPDIVVGKGEEEVRMEVGLDPTQWIAFHNFSCSSFADRNGSVQLLATPTHHLPGWLCE